MTVPDIRRWLDRQAADAVGFVAYDTVGRGPETIAAALDAETAAEHDLAIVDAVDDDQRAISRATGSNRLLVGGSGLTLGLPDDSCKVRRVSEGA